jgi:hypothetical protein
MRWNARAISWPWTDGLTFHSIVGAQAGQCLRPHETYLRKDYVRGTAFLRLSRRTDDCIYNPLSHFKSHYITRKIGGFHGGDYEERRLLGYKTPVRTSQETHHVSATQDSRLVLCKI